MTEPFLVPGVRRLLLEVHHPGHVLFAFALRDRLAASGADFALVAQARPEVVALLHDLGLEAATYPPRRSGLAGAASNLRAGWSSVSEEIRRVRPDRVLSIAGTYTAGPARRAGVRNAALSDTETATVSHLLAYPFADLVVHPRSYRLDLDRAALFSRGKRLFYDGHQEAAYLLSPAFRARVEREETPAEPFAFIRAIAWGAYHERTAGGGWDGIVAALRRLGIDRIVASCEGTPPPTLAPLRFRGRPLAYHAHLARAALVVTEGATTATEATYYGTPTVFVNRNLYGTIAEAVAEGRANHARASAEAARMVEGIDLTAWRARLREMGPRRGGDPLDALFGRAAA